MTYREFLDLLRKLSEEGPTSVAEQVEMTHPNGKPYCYDDGEQVVSDVVQIGDGRLYIQRDGNEPDIEQAVIDLLDHMGEFLPDLAIAFETYIDTYKVDL